MTRSRAGLAAAAAGATLVVLGLLGLVPGITTHYGHLGFWGSGSRALLFGRFRVSVLLDLLHGLAGAPGLVHARSPQYARALLTAAGLACLVLWFLGVVKLGSWIPTSGADDWLHLGLAAGLIGLARATGGRE